MKMYVANTTKQFCNFHYRVVETKGARMQRIGPGQQVMLADQELIQAEIDYIIKQHAPYGMIKIDDINRVKGYISRVYSIDRPVSLKVIDQVIRTNTAILIVKGKEARKLAAVQANNAIEGQMQEIAEQTQGAVAPKLRELDISVEQVEDPRAPFQPSDEAPERVAEGILVSREAPPEPTTGKRIKGRRAA